MKKKEEEVEVLSLEEEKPKKKTKKKKRKLKTKGIYIILFIILILIGFSCFLADVYASNNKRKEEQEQKEEIKKHYSTYVKVEKETSIYDSNKKEIGKVGKNVELTLDKQDNKYFKIKDEDYYVLYKDVTPIDKLSTYSTRYKNYVVFNENIVTKDKTTFYDEDNNLVYQINKSFDLPIIIKEDNRYGVEYKDRLLYVKDEDVKEKKKSENTNEETRDNIRTLTYHTIYNTETEKCTNTVICHPIEQFDSHMKYISENKYFTLTMEELEMFLNKQIRIPTKSIVITLDDGKYAINAVNIVEKYKVNATYFIISSRHSIEGIETTYMDFQSHSYNLHNNYKCSGGEQGGQLLCESKENILNDLKKSKEILGGDVFAFAYPFFDWNERAISILKEAGFRLAFIGQYDSDGYSTYKTDHMLLRRKTIFSDDSVDVLASYLK